MKKFLCCIFILVCCLSLSACGENSDKKDAYRALCDSFVEENIGTTQGDYTIDNISYKIHSFSVDQYGNPHVEIWWYMDVSGEYDAVKVLQAWIPAAIDYTKEIDIDGRYTCDVIYYNNAINDSITMILNNEHAMTGNDCHENRDYAHIPPSQPNTMPLVIIVIMAINMISGMVALAYGLVVKPRDLRVFFGGLLLLVISAIAAIFNSVAVSFVMIAVDVALIIAIPTAFLIHKRNNKMVDFYLDCGKKSDEEFMKTAEKHGYSDKDKALIAVKKGALIFKKRTEKEAYINSKKSAMEAKEKERSELMAKYLVAVAQNGGDVEGALREVSGYNKAVAEAEKREITNAAILGGVIGGVTGAIIAVETTKINIENRKRK